MKALALALLWPAVAAAADCPAGQTLREERFPGTSRVTARGCAKQLGRGRFSREGAWIFFSERGKKESEATYRADKKEGVATWYYESGRKQKEYTFKADKMEGPAVTWDEEGRETSRAVYRNDNLVSP